MSSKELSSYERAQLWNLYAFVYHAQERYPEAIDAFKKLLDEEELDEALKAGAVYSLAMLYSRRRTGTMRSKRSTSGLRSPRLPSLRRMSSWPRRTTSSKSIARRFRR